VVLVDDQDRLLLFKLRNSKSGTEWWATPGGGLDKGEKSVDGARRELREETGLDLHDLAGPVLNRDHWFRSDGELIHQRERFFYGRCRSFEPSRTGMDSMEADLTLEARWWTMDELDSTSERVYPEGIAKLVRGLIKDGVPADAGELADPG
jgi:ADP-ribose pyrophosphatase YjhB (NUDIX family)